jgi:hypothetical protein
VALSLVVAVMASELITVFKVSGSFRLDQLAPGP